MVVGKRRKKAKEGSVSSVWQIGIMICLKIFVMYRSNILLIPLSTSDVANDLCDG